MDLPSEQATAPAEDPPVTATVTPLYPVPDPASFAAEGVDAEEVLATDPAHIANTLNVYARVLVAHDLSAEVQQAAA